MRVIHYMSVSGSKASKPFTVISHSRLHPRPLPHPLSTLPGRLVIKMCHSHLLWMFSLFFHSPIFLCLTYNYLRMSPSHVELYTYLGICFCSCFNSLVLGFGFWVLVSGGLSRYLKYCSYFASCYVLCLTHLLIDFGLTLWLRFVRSVFLCSPGFPSPLSRQIFLVIEVSLFLRSFMFLFIIQTPAYICTRCYRLFRYSEI